MDCLWVCLFSCYLVAISSSLENQLCSLCSVYTPLIRVYTHLYIPEAFLSLFVCGERELSSSSFCYHLSVFNPSTLSLCNQLLSGVFFLYLDDKTSCSRKANSLLNNRGKERKRKIQERQRERERRELCSFGKCEDVCVDLSFSWRVLHGDGREGERRYLSLREDQLNLASVFFSKETKTS